MVVRSLEVIKDSFRPQEENDEPHGPEIPYLSVIGALTYLANATRPGIAFSINLLERYSSSPTQIHWNGTKDISRDLKGTSDMCLFYNNTDSADLVSHADAGSLSDPHKGWSQTGYSFTHGGTTISGDLQSNSLSLLLQIMFRQ